MWSIDDPQGFESRKIKYLLPKYTRGRVLEIGCGMEKAFPHFIGYDSGHHFGKGAADIQGDAADLEMFSDESFDAVFSSHVLEHMEDMEAAFNEWTRLVKLGGYICLYVPSANLYPKVGEPGANPDHKHDIYPQDLLKLLDNSDDYWEIHEYDERRQGNEYSTFLVAKKIRSDFMGGGYEFKEQDRYYQACVCRFGGFGDMIQTAVILPRLKEQGYDVTVMTTPAGYNILKDDPNVYDWYIIDNDQVPNHELHDFWKMQATRFHKFVQLSESIEGQLLALPGRPNHAWPYEVRKKRLNTNYHEWTAELAGVTMKPCQLFYPTKAEQRKVQCRKEDFNIVWALSGSSQHKFTPHMDAVIARILLEMPEAKVKLVGDFACKLLEQGWENEPRVACLSNELSIRETLALAQAVDLVIGPETGVLNAVGFEEVSKVLLLSHSSPNNLSKHWKNTQALTPEDCRCYPCHRLHYNADYCDIVAETGAARCAQNISAAVIYDAVAKVYRKWRRK